MTDSGLYPGKLPVLANAAGLETQAKEIRTQGAKISTTATTIHKEWQKLAAHFKSPDTATLTAALKPGITDGDSVKTDAETVAKALEAYAKTERTLQARKTTLLTDIANFDKSIEGDDEWKKDEDKVKAQQALVGRMNQLAADHTAAEITCQNAIAAIYGGVRYRQQGADGGEAPNGEQHYGYTKEVLDSAAGAGDLPWAKVAEWDKPWYRDVWDGVKSFGSGLWESVKGTVTGLKAMLNPFDWKTFSSTWKGVGTLALDVAVATSPVATVLMPERAKESRTRLKQVGTALLNVEEWKRNPAKAAGMLTGDVLQTLIPGVGGGRAVVVAGRASRVVGRAGQVATKLGASERVVKTSTDAVTKTMNTVAFKIDDVGHATRQAGYRVTNPVMDRVVPHVDRARATITRFNNQVSPYVRAAGDAVVEPWERKSSTAHAVSNQNGTAAVRRGAPGGIPGFGPERDFATLLKTRQEQVATTRPPGGGSGSGNGHLPAAADPSYVPKEGEVLLRPRDKWSEGQRAEFTKKVDGLNDAIDKKGDVTYVKEKAPRTSTRARVMSDFADRAYAQRVSGGSMPREFERMKVPADVQAKIEAAAVRAESSRVGSLSKSQYEGIIREELRKYDLDHTRDLQVGGLDDAESNMQWLERSVNRSVGAQLRNQGRRVVNPFVKSGSFRGPGTGTQVTEFVAGAAR